MMEGSQKKKPKKPNLLADTVFSWSLDDIVNERLFKNKVEKIPKSFHSVEHYFSCFLYPLLEETRAQVHSSMETIYRAPFAKVVSFEKVKQYGTKLYDIKVDYWRNRFNDRGKEPYDTLPGDLFVLANAKPETLSDLQRVGRTWAFASVTKVSEYKNKDESTSIYFQIKASKELEVVKGSASLFLVFLVNLIPNGRIWKALHMSKNVKIIKEVLCTDSVAHTNLCSEKNNDTVNKGLVQSLSSGLNESQNETVLACLQMLHCREKSAIELIWGPPGTGKTKTVVTLLLTLLQMNCRTLVCAPTNVAITEVASRVVKMLTEVESNSLFCSFGKLLLFGNKERLNVGSDIEEIYLDYRVKRLGECFGPQTGWKHYFASMIDFLEMKRKESKSDTKVGKEMCKSFLELVRGRFVTIASPLRYCLSFLHTHMAENCISVENVQNMVLLINLLDSFESLLFQDDVASEALEDIFSCSDSDDILETHDDNYFLLLTNRRECLKVLHTVFDSLSELHIPNFVEQESLIEFCFQKASLIFCTASSSYKLHKLAMEPVSIVVIDEAAQLKECESTIPLQLLGVKHAVLVGDEYQLPATVESIVSDKAGFARSLFERLSSVGHSKHLLNMQYRMHPAISFFPNSRFYNNMIRDAPNLRSRSQEKQYLTGSMFGPYSFINVVGGREEKDEDGRSRKNMVEVAIVSQILRNLYKKWVESRKTLSIGIVSPYAAQVVAIEEKLAHKYNSLDGFTVKVKTVDGFQGGEEDIIILSTVRSNYQRSLEFVSKPQRVNVSLTRARHCLWILGDEKVLCDNESVWKAVVLDAKSRQCFFNADEDKDLAKAILEVKKQYDQLDDLLNADSMLFRSARWKVLFSDNFLKSFKKLTSVRLKRLVLNVLLKLASGWRPKKKNSEINCGGCSQILKKFKVENLYVLCTTDIAKDSRYFQVLKIWDLLPLEDVPTLVNRLDRIMNKYADGFISLCKEKCLEGDLEVPRSWPPSMELLRFKDLSFTKSQIDHVSDTFFSRNYAENSQVSESLLLTKFYSLSCGVVNHLLSDCEGIELDLPFEVTEQEMDIILHRKSSFIVGRSGTGKTTVLTTKLFQKEQWHQLAVQGGYSSQSSSIGQSSAATEEKVLHQLFVTVSPKLCYAMKRHVLNLKRFACGGSHLTESSLIDKIDFDEDETQFNDIQNSFHEIPTHSYPLFITFHKFLIMLDGTLSNSYLERFLDANELTHGRLQSSRSAALQNVIRTKEVSYEKFSVFYWLHFNTDLTKRLDASRVFTEIISHMKGGLGAIEACNGKLSREAYVQLSDIRASNLTRQEREVIYDIFQLYEKRKTENGEFDLADFVIDLHHRLMHENYRGDQMDYVYVDEVQDLTMSQIALFKHMCHNVEEGFVFSGDTAQTIARGIDFRFQELRHLFYKKFVLESTKRHDESKEKGQVSEILHLTQNFRTHDGVLKLSQSIVDLLYHFFPLSIDVLKPESSLIYGEAPVLLESGDNENAIIKIFGNSGNIVGFGAEQVILVRDGCARKEISKFVGKHALVLTIVECKGLEFQDVLLYNFFGSSPAKNEWRVIYDYMNELDLLDHTLPRGFPGFDVAKHNILCSELKQLYVAVTRTRQRLWICENLEELSKPMFDYWQKKCLVQVKRLDDSLAHAMQVASTPDKWKSRGIKLFHEQNYEMATMCFERAGDSYWERRSKAAGLKALADHMRISNPEKAKSILRDAAEIFTAIGKADSAARCFSDLGEYERAARIYLNKCGESELKRAAECFSLAGRYKEAADAYAKGKFFSDCLIVCEKGKLFDLGLQYISDWKQHAEDDTTMPTRAKGVKRMQLEFLESCALHYRELNDNRSMMKFVKAFPSVTLMRDFLKRLDSLDELLMLEEDFGNYMEAANIAQSKGEILLECDFLEKARKFKEASLKIIFYVFSMSLWSSGSKGWPLKKFPQKDALLAKAKSLAKNETDNFHDLVCTEVDILSNREDKLAVMKNQLNSCQRHLSFRGEVLCARKVLDVHLSQRTDKYIWEKELIGDLVQNSEEIISKNQVSIDSLVYFWNFWKEKILKIYESVRCLNTPEGETQESKGYVECCLTFLGVCRLYQDLSPVYVLLIPRADWARCLERRHFQNHGKLVSIDGQQLISAAQNYWSSEVISVGMKVLEKLEALYKFPVKNSDSNFFQSKSLTLIYDVAMYLVNSKCLKLRHQDTIILQRFVTSSSESLVSYMFPLDGRNSLTDGIISLRRTDAIKNALRQVIVEYTQSEGEPSFSNIGKIAMIILGTGKLKGELYDKLFRKLVSHSNIRTFIVFLCETIGRGEIIYTSVMLPYCNKKNVNGRVTYSYMSPGCFLYILERLLIWAALTQGYVLTTSSCFIEWLIYQDEDTHINFTVEADRSPALEGIIEIAIKECIKEKKNMIEWFEKSDKNWKKHYPLYIFRLVVLLCLLYVNFDLCLDTLFDFMGKSYVAEQLPCDFYDTFRREWVQDCLKRGKNSLSVNVLAAALKKVDNDLVIASFGPDCSRFLCSDAIFIDMTANQCKDDILSKLYPKQQR